MIRWSWPSHAAVWSPVLCSRQELGAELDVVLARKLRAQWQPELAIGAVAEDGKVYVNPEFHELLDTDQKYVAGEQPATSSKRSRGERPSSAQSGPKRTMEGRSVIVTDDGIATGATVIAALEVVREESLRANSHGARRLPRSNPGDSPSL